MFTVHSISTMCVSLLILAFNLVFVACGASTISPTSTPVEPIVPTATPQEAIVPTATIPEQSSSSETPDELLEQVQREITQEGQAFRAVITTTVTAGEAFPENAGQSNVLWTEEIWIAPDERAARWLFVKDPENTGDFADEAATLFVDGTIYFEDDNEIDAVDWQNRCLPVEPPALIAFMLETSCREFGPSADMEEPVSVRVDRNVIFGDVQATAIVFEQVIQPEGQPSPTPFSPAPPTPYLNINPQQMEARLYLNSETLLPIAWETQTWDHAGLLMVTMLASFENEFIPQSELESGFFDPAAFGYIARDILAPLDDPNLDVTVYWLGETFAPGGDLPTMELSDILGLAPPGGGPGHQAMLSYTPIEGVTSAFGFRIQVWTPEGWNGQGSQIGSDIWQHPCVEPMTIPVEGGTATIYQSYEPNSDGVMPGSPGACPDREHDRFMTVIDYGDTLVTINAPLANMIGPRGNENAIDPYDSLDGMLAIIEGLQPR